MAAETSDRYSLPFIQAAQAQKELMHNEALAMIDILLHAQAESASLAAPPPGALSGQCWIVAPGASGEWAGNDGKLAAMTSGGWRFVAPRAGMRVAISDEGMAYIYNGTSWSAEAVRSDGYYVDGEKIIGERAGAIPDPTGGASMDSEARTAIINILSVLRGHGLISIA